MCGNDFVSNLLLMLENRLRLLFDPIYVYLYTHTHKYTSLDPYVPCVWGMGGRAPVSFEAEADGMWANPTSARKGVYESPILSPNIELTCVCMCVRMSILYVCVCV